MPKTIVVPLDQSEIAERALPVAEALARQLDARVRLVSVFEIPPEYMEWFDQHVEEERWSKPRAELEAYLEDVSAPLEVPEVSTELLTGKDPAIEVHETVAEMDDAILVISTRGRSGIERLVLGSRASRFVQLATYPLVVVPAECEQFPTSVSKILVPLDGSTFAEHALGVTLDLLTGRGKPNPSLHLVRVVDQIYVETEFDADLRRELFEEANRYLSQVADRLNDQGCDVSWEVEESYDIANRIVTLAHMAKVDLIAMATHGRTGFSRFFLGSVADAVLRTANKPVLIIRPPEEVVAEAPEERKAVVSGDY